MAKISQNFKKQAKSLAKLMSEEMGKPLIEAEGEMALTIDYLNFYAKEAEKYLQDEVLHKDKQATSILRYDPVGVVAVIKPWNFPVLTSIWALKPAILTGNSVLFKPASLVPLCQSGNGEVVLAGRGAERCVTGFARSGTSRPNAGGFSGRYGELYRQYRGGEADCSKLQIIGL